MISTYLACLSPQAIVRFSSIRLRSLGGLVLLVLTWGCSEQPKSVVEQTGETIPAMGQVTQQTAPMSLKVQIDLGAVRERVSPTSKVFVFVRESGQRMPLGVEQFTVGTLPANVEFHTTNSYSAVSVVARVSPSGRVEKSPDDFEVSAMASFGHPAPVVSMSFDDGTNSSVPPDMETSASGQKGVVTVNLSLNLPKVEIEKLGESARVFVVAKAPSSPIPLAVKAFPVDAVPDQLMLSDADAMMPTRTLSAATEFQLSAHLSRSGDVSRDVGDWEGFAEEPSAAAPNTYNIRLDKQIQ